MIKTLLRDQRVGNWILVFHTLYKQLNAHTLRKKEATEIALLLRQCSIELFGGTSSYWVWPLRGYNLSLVSYLTTADSLTPGKPVIAGPQQKVQCVAKAVDTAR